MKTINVFKAFFTILLVGTILSLNTFGGNPSKDAREYPYHAKQVKQVLEQTVKFPDCGLKKGGHGEAVVIFSIADDGKIEIDGVSANCKELEKYIREQLTNLYFNDVIHPFNQHYKVKFTFLPC
jgi:hypothetical protein